MQGFLGALRNRACKRAKGTHLIVCDDDILFAPDFYKGLLQYGEDYDVLACKLMNPNGTRHWDWSTYGGPTGHHLLDYDEPDDGYAYPPGGLVVLKRATFERVQWSETIGFQVGAAEDVDYGERLHAAGYTMKFNPYSIAVHNDPRYTQQGRIVIRSGV
jgi:GT2 family glycosyltransferase